MLLCSACLTIISIQPQIAFSWDHRIRFQICCKAGWSCNSLSCWNPSMPRHIFWCELLSFTNMGCVYNAACHYMSRFAVNDGGYMYMHLLEWRMKDLKRKPTADLQQRELICQALVGYIFFCFWAAAGESCVALWASVPDKNKASFIPK